MAAVFDLLDVFQQSLVGFSGIEVFDCVSSSMEMAICGMFGGIRLFSSTLWRKNHHLSHNMHHVLNQPGEAQLSVGLANIDTGYLEQLTTKIVQSVWFSPYYIFGGQIWLKKIHQERIRKFESECFASFI